MLLFIGFYYCCLFLPLLLLLTINHGLINCFNKILSDYFTFWNISTKCDSSANIDCFLDCFSYSSYDWYSSYVLEFDNILIRSFNFFCKSLYIFCEFKFLLLSSIFFSISVSMAFWNSSNDFIQYIALFLQKEFLDSSL